MNKKMRKWTAGALLAVALCGVTVGLGRADDEEDAKKLKQAIAAATEEVLKNLNKVGTADFPAMAGKIAKEHKIEATMKLFKPKSKNGVGIGGLTGASHKDSIELLIRDYTIKAPNKAEVTKYADDLVKLAQITSVVAEMTPSWVPLKDGPAGKTKAKWMQLSEEMRKGSAELVAAAKAKDDKAVEAAAKKLNGSCAECHKIFRDDK